MACFETITGTAGLRLADIAHVLVPGRGRDSSGAGLNVEALDRLKVAQDLYNDFVCAAQGRIVCSGYKSPIDRKGERWRSEQAPYQIMYGVPEARLMKDALIRAGVPADSIQVESRSIDTVTNFLRSELENYFGDDRPVAIVAQAAHLERMLSVIAPRTLRRSYIGVVVPTHDPSAIGESPLAAVVSRLVVSFLPSESNRAIRRATMRANLAWRAAWLVGKRNYH